mmetsp:Transcript_23752/g.61705  ORF Transcript_23752/g.61705 Transcript_23752/m.61705 type:complete len:458 (+) Transcript_23752:102-1475(+)
MARLGGGRTAARSKRHIYQLLHTAPAWLACSSIDRYGASPAQLRYCETARARAMACSTRLQSGKRGGRWGSPSASCSHGARGAGPDGLGASGELLRRHGGHLAHLGVVAIHQRALAGLHVEARLQALLRRGLVLHARHHALDLGLHLLQLLRLLLHLVHLALELHDHLVVRSIHVFLRELPLIEPPAPVLALGGPLVHHAAHDGGRLERAAPGHLGNLALLPGRRNVERFGVGCVLQVVNGSRDAARVVARHLDVPGAVDDLCRLQDIAFHGLKAIVIRIPAQVGFPAGTACGVVLAEIPLGRGHQHARVGGRVAREVVLDQDEDLGEVLVLAAVSPAAKATVGRKLPRVLALLVSTHGILPRRFQDVVPQVAQHGVLILEGGGGHQVAVLVLGHHDLLEGAHHLAALVRGRLEVEHQQVGDDEEGVQAGMAVLGLQVHRFLDFLLHRLRIVLWLVL